MSCKCKNKPCGCEDQALTTGPVCPQDAPACPRPDPCSETFSTECIVHIGDTIVDLDIRKGDRLDDILQKMVLLLTNNACILPGATCQSPVGLRSIAITNSSIKVEWDATPNATTYEVEYKLAAAVTWTSNPAVVQALYPQDTIGLLAANSEYHIRVRAICGVNPTTCTSVTILVKTKP